MKGMRPLRQWRTAIVLSVLISASCGRGSSEQAQPAIAVNVRTTTVTQQPFTETVGALGAVEASAGHIALLSAPAPTRVLQVLVAEGQRVARGSTLVVLEQTPFREAERSAAAKLNAAQRAYDRARTLSQAGILPRKDVEQAAADLAAARADLVAARRLTQLSVLRAPISGVVTRMSALLGASVDTNEPLVEIADPSALEVILGMTPADAGKVRIGNKVALRAGQNRSGEMLGTGTVKSVGAVVDSVSRNVSVRVVPPTTSRPMRIGETVYGDVAVATRAAVIVVPVEALVPEGDQFRVFIIDAKNVVHARPVIIGARDPRIAEVRSGLTAGERIVTYGAYGLEDGATVVPARQ